MNPYFIKKGDGEPRTYFPVPEENQKEVDLDPWPGAGEQEIQVRTSRTIIGQLSPVRINRLGQINSFSSPRNASPVKGNVEGSPLTDVATKGREGLDSSLLTSSPVASDPFPEAGVTQGYDDNRAEPSVVDSYGGSKFERFLQLTQAGKAQLRKQL
ncbi:unnamed protein product [Cochlearia groenlandica]